MEVAQLNNQPRCVGDEETEIVYKCGPEMRGRTNTKYGMVYEPGSLQE